MTRTPYSPSYSELPPQEIYVEASNQLDSVRVTTATSMSDRSLEFPSARRVADDPKTKFFTFERLTPVSTSDDAREDAVTPADGTLPDNENEVLRDENGICSPLTSDLSQDKDQNDDNDDFVENEQIFSVPSSVRERVAAWEKRTASWRSTDLYDVPFDEDPMHKEQRKGDGVHVCEVIDDFDASKETITEIPVEDMYEDSNNHDAVNSNETSSNAIVSHVVIAAENETPITHPVTSISNLLDEDDDQEIHTAPSDEIVQPTDSTNEVVVKPSVYRSADETTGKGSVTKSMNIAESFSCPATDAICTQVSKLWSS